MAGDTRAAAWLVRAGQTAQRVYAWVTAAARFEQALALMEDPDADAEERAWLLFRLARMRRYANPRQALAYLTEALSALVMTNDAAAEAFIMCHRGLLRCLAADIPAGIAEMRAGVAGLAALPEADRLRLREQTQRVDVSDPDEFEGTLV